MSALLSAIKSNIETGDFRQFIPVPNFSLKQIQGCLHIQFDSHLQSFSHEKMPRGMFKLKSVPIIKYKLNVLDHNGVITFKWASEKPDNWMQIEGHIRQFVLSYSAVSRSKNHLVF